jgi:hypothetical protein
VIGRTSAALLLLPVAGLACGGSGADATCGHTQPCGGDPMGSWTITAGCANPAVAASELMTTVGGPCPNLAVTSTHDEASGTLAFAADMTYTATAAIGGTITATIPSSCIDEMPCAAVETFLSMEGLLVHACTGTTTCTCTIDRVPLALDGGGTYVASGNLLELHPDSGASVVMKEYCVVGSRMHLIGANGPTIVDDVVLARVTR